MVLKFSFERLTAVLAPLSSLTMKTVIQMPFILLVRATSQRRMDACPCASPCFDTVDRFDHLFILCFGLECLLHRLLAPGPLALLSTPPLVSTSARWRRLTAPALLNNIHHFHNFHPEIASRSFCLPIGFCILRPEDETYPAHN